MMITVITADVGKAFHMIELLLKTETVRNFCGFQMKSSL